MHSQWETKLPWLVNRLQINTAILKYQSALWMIWVNLNVGRKYLHFVACYQKSLSKDFEKFNSGYVDLYIGTLSWYTFFFINLSQIIHNAPWYFNMAMLICSLLTRSYGNCVSHWLCINGSFYVSNGLFTIGRPSVSVDWSSRCEWRLTSAHSCSFSLNIA